MKRREVKSKGEKERYSHLNAEFQRTARRHKKAFLSSQCKEIEENNRMGKTRELFKKIYQGTISCKDGHNKGQKKYEAEDIKKILRRDGKNTQNYTKKDFNDPNNHNGVITHLELDNLECEVKWALGSIMMNKARGGDEIPVELFQILTDDPVIVLHTIC